MTTRNALVIHVYSEDAGVLTVALRVARNAVHDLDPDAMVQVVVQGGAVRGLIAGGAYPDDLIATIHSAGVQVLACQNSMSREGVNADLLLKGVSTVAAAVGYLARQQWAGAAYVRL